MSVYLPSFISFNILVNMLHPSSLFTCYTCLCFVVGVVNKLRLQYEGAPKYLGESVTGMKFGLRKRWRGSNASIVTRGECHRHEIWVKEKMKRFKCIYSNWGFWHWCWQMHRQTTVFPVYMHSGFPAGRSKQMIVTSWNDNTVMSCAILGGNYKWGAHTNPGAVIWVFWYWMVGSIDKSQTLYSGHLSTSHGAEHHQDELCVLFIHMHVSRPFWELFSQYDFSCLMLAG